MKTVLKYLMCGCFIMLTLIACDRDAISIADYSAPNSSNPYPDTLSGHTFILNLVWTHSADDGITFAKTDYRPDLFFDPKRAMEVSIRNDTSSTWEDVNRIGNNACASSQFYVYSIYSEILYLYPCVPNPALDGISVFVKVKFL